jgi:hypothetical protein
VSEDLLAFTPSDVPAGAPVMMQTTRYDYARYRPRRRYNPRYEDRQSRSESYTQIHGGFFDPDGDPSSEVLGGVRLAAMVDPHVAIGGQVDWSHRGETDATVISTTPAPGGGPPIEVVQELGRSTADLVPMMGFLQFSGDQGMGLVPYVGIGGGYELLFLSADDVLTGTSYDATFGGWGWQAWAGLAVPLSPRARLTAEIFRNGAELQRDVNDPVYGTIREKVDVDGTGARFGIAFGF